MTTEHKTTAKTTKHPHASISNDPTNQTEDATMPKTAHPATHATHATRTATSPAPTVEAATTTSSSSSTSSTGLAALVTQLCAQLDAAEQQMGPADPVTSTQKRRTGKPRKGSEKALAQLAPIVKQYGLESASLSTDQMMSRHQLAQTLVPLQARLTKVSKRVDDDVFNAQTDAWDMGLQFYSLLRRRAKTDGSVEATIAPLAKSFSYRNPKAKEGKPTKLQMRLKSQLEKTLALANKHGVSLTVGASGQPVAIAGPAPAVAAAQAELVTSGVAAAPATQGSATQSPAAPATAGPAGAATTAGAAHS
jgi:hypothetical protein